MKDTLIRIALSPQEIATQNTTAVTALLDPNRLSTAELRVLHGRVTIGLDSALPATGRKALFEVAEVRAFCDQLKQDFPYWFFYLRLDIACLWILTASVLPKLAVIRNADSVERITRYDLTDMREFIDGLAPATRAICNEAGFTAAQYRNLMARVRRYYRSPA